MYDNWFLLSKLSTPTNPRLIIPKFNSRSFQRSILYKATKNWNDIVSTKVIEFDEDGFCIGYVDRIMDYLVRVRSSIFLY